MHGDECDVEAAGEEAEYQKNVRVVSEGFAKCFPEGLRLLRRAGTHVHRRGPDDESKRKHHEDQNREDDQGLMPANFLEQTDRKWREEELTERSGRGAKPECKAAPLLG